MYKDKKNIKEYINGRVVVRTTLRTLNFYCLVIVIHYFVQALFAYLNYRKVTKKV